MLLSGRTSKSSVSKLNMWTSPHIVSRIRTGNKEQEIRQIILLFFISHIIMSHQCDIIIIPSWNQYITSLNWHFLKQGLTGLRNVAIMEQSFCHNKPSTDSTFVMMLLCPKGQGKGEWLHRAYSNWRMFNCLFFLEKQQYPNQMNLESRKLL